MSTVYVSAGSGQTATAAFTLVNPGPFAVSVSSLTAPGPVGLEFSENSGSAPFKTLMRNDGTALPFFVHSGIGQAFGMVPYAPTPWGRLTVASGGGVSSFSIISITQ